MPSIRLAELHPIIVHFPLALLLASVALDFAAVFLRRASLAEGATLALMLGAPGTLAALASGWLSEKDANLALAGDLLHLHKVCAVLASVVFVVLFLLRLAWQSPRLFGWLRMVYSAVEDASIRPGVDALAAAPGLREITPAKCRGHLPLPECLRRHLAWADRISWWRDGLRPRRGRVIAVIGHVVQWSASHSHFPQHSGQVESPRASSEMRQV